MKSAVMVMAAKMALSWEPVRFARQAWFFNQPFTRPLAALDGSTRLYPRKGVEWGPLDDVVMGGASSSSWQDTAQGGLWRGTVTTANNGGFAGARCRPFRPPIDASRYTGIRVRVTSPEGLRFKCIVRDNEEWNGIAWTWCFDTLQNESVDIALPFSEAKPTKFAATLSEVPPLDTSKLVTVQFVLSKFEFDGELNPRFQEGSFSLKIESIDMY